jgi:hypothetical protein
MIFQGVGTLFGQESPEPLRLVFNQYATKEAGQDWSDWKPGQNVFVLFYNNNGDLVHYKSGGKRELYVKRTDWTEVKDKNNNEYIYANFILENGVDCMVQVYTKPRVFVKVIIDDGGLVVQFDNS